MKEIAVQGPSVNDNVRFEFYHVKKRHVVLDGRVEVNGDDMTLVVELPDDDPYVIRGKKRADGTFAGRHEGAEDDYEVAASWTMLDQSYIGRWHEEDEFFLISFKLPSMDGSARQG